MNPFNPYQPAEGDLFADRKREQQWFLRGFLPSLHPDSTGVYNAAVLGPWGIGKSSLVRQLRYLAKAQDQVKIGMAYLSCTTGYGDLFGLFRALVSSVRDEILLMSAWSESIKNELDRWSVQISLPAVSLSRSKNTPTDTASAAEYLRTSLLRLWEKFLKPRDASMILVLDDANLLQSLDSQALMVLRAVFQDLHMYHTRYALVITGPSSLFQEIHDIAEPVTRFFEHLQLDTYSWNDMNDAINEPLNGAKLNLTVAPSVIQWIWSKTLGHPYFVTFVMRDLVEEALYRGWKSLQETHALELWGSIIEHIEHGKFDSEWNSATVAERKALVTLAMGDDHKINRGLYSRLAKKNLLVRVERGSYTLYHPMFNDYVIKHSSEAQN